MPCYHPLEGFRSAELTKNGKRKLTFSPKHGYVDLPVTVPCGQCIGCRLERSRQWAIRLVHEGQLHEDKCFLTLTYDDKHLPGGNTLVKSHFQNFMKRLRKKYPDKSIRYFHCGEYGETTKRPHYHAIIYGLTFEDAKFYTRNKQGQNIQTSEILDRLWRYGECKIGQVTFESAAYVARYVVKKVTGRSAEDHYKSFIDPQTGEINQVIPEYCTMSLKPALGNGWYEKYETDVFPDDHIIIRGKEMPPPRRYMLLKEKQNPKEFAIIKRNRLIKNHRNKANNTPERLIVREEVKLAQIKSLKRDI